MRRLAIMIAVVALVSGAARADDKFDVEEVITAGYEVFGETTDGVANVIKKVFEDLGPPNGVITGDEVSGAFWVGLRYGRGELVRKQDQPRKVYWQGPSIGFDFGGNASRVLTLVYHLDKSDDIFQRFPGVDGSIYVFAGLSVNYQQSGNVILAPIRTGVGLRAGANVGYLNYTRERGWLPF